MDREPVPPPLGSDPGVENPAERGKSRVFPCGGCGANLAFDVHAHQLKCPYCGHEQDLGLDPDRQLKERDLEAELGRESERRKSGQVASLRRAVKCDDCGGETTFEGTLTAQACPYCAAPLQLRDAHAAEDRVAVDGVLPFAIPSETAQIAVVGWIRSRWFAPSGFAALCARGGLQGVYLPYWTFDAVTSNSYRGERGDHYWVTVQRGKETVQEMRTRWSPAAGSFRRLFDDVLIRGTRGDEGSLSVRLLDGLEPWPLNACLPFTDAALAGFLARTYDVGLGSAFRQGKAAMEGMLRQEVQQRIGGDEQRIHAIRSDFAALTYKHLLLPAWLLTYRFRGKPYRVAVNGATGEVRGERPYSVWKILGLVGVIAAAVTAIVLATR